MFSKEIEIILIDDKYQNISGIKTKNSYNLVNLKYLKLITITKFIYDQYFFNNLKNIQYLYGNFFPYNWPFTENIDLNLKELYIENEIDMENLFIKKFYELEYLSLSEDNDLDDFLYQDVTINITNKCFIYFEDSIYKKTHDDEIVSIVTEDYPKKNYMINRIFFNIYI
jgi:hypothetical protein